MELNKFYKYAIGIILVLIIIFLLAKMPFLAKAIRLILGMVLFPIFVGGFIYYMLRPFVNYLESKKFKRSFSILVVFLLIIAVISLILIYSGGIIRKEFVNLFSRLKKVIEMNKINANSFFEKKLESIIPISNIKQEVFKYLEVAFKSVGKRSTTFFNSITNIGVQIVLIPFVVFYFLKDGETFVNSFLNMISIKRLEKVKIILSDIDKALSVYISGRLITAVFVGILTFIGYIIIKLPNAFILSFITMIFSIIPFIGPIISLIPALLIAVGNNTFMIIKVLIVVSIVQQIEGNIITPKIMVNKLNIHPLTTIFLIIISTTLFGVIGTLISIPLYVTLRIIIKDIHSYKNLGKLKK